jgi:hypothetical protein
LDGAANGVALATRPTILGVLWFLHDIITASATIAPVGAAELREQILNRCITSKLLIGIIWCTIDLSLTRGL